MESILYGRELLLSELSSDEKEVIQNDKVHKSTGFVEKNGLWRCRRCNSIIKQGNYKLCNCELDHCNYCTTCILMGKVSRCSQFYSIPEPNFFMKANESFLRWQGTLSPQQEMASKDILHSILDNETRLLWAVAGAGKTEMLFEGINFALMNQKRVCIASPRVDVCLELAPRIQEAFPDIKLVVLYGEMEASYEYTQLVIATTHQLYRFKEAFDVLIIDEIDAFPFHMDESLRYGAEKSRKKDASMIFLSATPDRKLQKQIKQKKIEASILPARYHGSPLPVPVGKWSGNWQTKLLQKPKSSTVVKHIDQLIKQKKRFLIFIPNIEWMYKFEKALKSIFKNVNFESVHSADPKRKEKIMKMRNKEVAFLLTTTILERGVTFPNVDVIVIGAEDRTFTESALVQISGRVGRSPSHPSGNVTFYHSGWTREMKRAVKQIKKLNSLAKKRGLLHG